ncbi:ESF1 homolog [Belonocnema kinseyi]|uniref:ESF1 homolog n=1 Tax=Belonocnema kinseyi TaxID=2817044 RepID=UPI00143DECCC|nr:ESF1 homolog [Belonocnema kinseyi]XP_033219218.1 ESF1 homolog [Belonocnema kinseyi]XP_033219219.1 ESF1 homolog [Belonocnema kinseyi]XP_033219221.1 ESF1 homolog [Belonocnema kinseyi]XP_033219222.1 ESF1 homolog [Belonocnema kinseyi]
MDKILKDDRFTHIFNDPKFRRIPKNERKVKIDKRFQSMFKDKKFSVNSTIDKRGKPSVQSSGENLRKYYNISDSEDDESLNTGSGIVRKTLKKIIKEKGCQVNNAFNKGKNLLVKVGDKEKESASEGAQESLLVNKKENKTQLCTGRKNENTKISHDIKKKLRDLSVDYARGEGLLVSDSSSDEESLYNSDSGEDINHNWGEFDKEAADTNISTYRLAACNMDWDNIRAVDIMTSLHSFAPSGGLIHSVTIYPSEFGLKRLEDEEVNGPTELIDKCINDIDKANEEGSSYHMEKLRQYELNKLRYYYAVIVCDSPETADKIWNKSRNFEYESSGIKYDLRFIPDDMDFDQVPTEFCDKLPNFSTYQPRIFTTTALQQEKVELTWDETCTERKEITRKLNSGRLDELNESHLKTLLACETSEDECDRDDNKHVYGLFSEVKGNTINKYKLLLKSIKEKEKAKNQKDMQLECSWGLSANDRNKDLVKDKKRKVETQTPFKQYDDKHREKQKAIRNSKFSDILRTNDLILESVNDIPLGVDMNDPYFADESKNRYSKTKTSQNSAKKLKTSRVAEEQNAELELVLMDKSEYNSKNHFDIRRIAENESLTKYKKKRSKRQNKDVCKNQNVNFKIDVQDPRFEALFTSHNFNIDPAHPNYRKTKATESVVNEKLKRRNMVHTTESTSKKNRNEKQINPELTVLVKSVKRNLDKQKKRIG